MSKESQDFKDIFVQVSEAYGKTVESGHYDEANDACKVFESLISSVQDSTLFDDMSFPDTCVWTRYWYAKAVMSFDQKRAEKILESLVVMSGVVSILSDILLNIVAKTKMEQEKINILFPHLGKAGSESGQVAWVRDFNFLKVFGQTTIRDVLLTLDIEDQRRIGLKTVQYVCQG